MGYSIFGNTTGLKPGILKKLERLYYRRIPPASIITPELAREIAKLSAEINRQIGILINRKGEITHVIVGTHHQIEIPELRGYRDYIARLKGLRLIHTHFVKEFSKSRKPGTGFNKDDLLDLAFLRLDLLGSLEVNKEGEPGRLHLVHILPFPEMREKGLSFEERFFYFYPPKYVWDIKENFLELIKTIEAELERIKPAKSVRDSEDRALLILLKNPGDRDTEERLAELKELAHTAGVTIVGEIVQQRHSPDPKYVIGKGKLLEVMIEAMRTGANLLIFDRELSPSQVRSLTEITDLRVIDRTQLILDIFAQRATSKEGKIQVEIAQLKYALPRLRAKDDAFSRLTGGIGARGPGETKLEIDRRRIKDKIARLERKLKEISMQRELRRKKRKKLNFKVVVLIGYTNAGKTTLLNVLSRTEYLAEDKLFATLDPVTKAVKLPGGNIALFTDTVGFIRDLPEELKKAFKATLEELYTADLFLHIVDASHPDIETHLITVEALLEEMDLLHVPRLVVLNKIDKIEEELPPALLENRYKGVAISARTGKNLDKLLRKVEEMLFPSW